MAAAVAALAFVDEDVNGDYYIGGQEGEVFAKTSKYTVLIPPNIPVAARYGEEVALTTHQLMEIVLANAVAIAGTVENITPTAAVRLAYVRALVVKRGLVSPAFPTDSNYVKYNDAEQMADNEHAADTMVRLYGAFAYGIANNLQMDENWFSVNAGNMLNAAARAWIRQHVTDMVCLVAYFFRARAHHYTDDMQAGYERIWTKCRYDAQPITDMGGWKNVATVGLHGIFPNMLDAFWLQSINDNRCNGALKKRRDVAAAGTAIVRAITAGYRDIATVFPNLSDRFPGVVGYVNQLVTKFSGPEARWVGSVNRNFYGVADPYVVDEAQLAPLAASIKGIYDLLAANSTLTASPALTRVANAAPVVGGVLGRAAQRAAQDERLSLLPPKKE